MTLYKMDRSRSPLHNIKQDLKTIFHEISDEKGQMREDEIQQLVGLLRSKVKKLQTSNRRPTIPGLVKLSEKMEVGGVNPFISELNDLNNGKTRTVLEAISEKISNYIIQEKGGIFEKDIIEMADQLRNFSRLSIIYKNCNNSNKAAKAENSINYNLSTPATINKKLITNRNSEKYSNSKSKTETSCHNYINLENEQRKKDLNDEERHCENSENNSNIDTSNRYENHNIDPSFKSYKDQICVQKDISDTNQEESERQLLKNADSRCTYIIEKNSSSMSSLIKDEQKPGNLSIIKPGRSQWNRKKSKIIYKTASYMNTVTYVNSECKKIQDNTNDNSSKTSLLFNKVIDVILEKYNIEESDVEEIVDILKQCQTEEKDSPLKKDFVSFTPDTPRWVLRGYLSDVTGSNDFRKPMSYLLNKITDCIVYNKGKICQSDIIKLRSVLTRKIIGTTEKDDGKTVRISQLCKTNLKSKEKACSAKCHQTQNLQNSQENAKDKNPFLPKELKNGETTSNSEILKKNVDSSQISFIPESVNNAVEQGIRSLEFIKNLSEQLLLDLDEHPKTNNKNMGLNNIIPLQIYQCHPMSPDISISDVIQKSIKNKSIVKPPHNVKQGGSTVCRKPFNDNQLQVKPMNQIIDLNVREKNAVLITNTDNIKGEQLSKQMQRSKQSNNENDKIEQEMNKNESLEKEKSTQKSPYHFTRCKTDIKRSSKVLSKAFSVPMESSNHSFTDRALTIDSMNSTSKYISNCPDINKNINLKKENKKLTKIPKFQLYSFLDENEEDNSNGSKKQQVYLKIIKRISVRKTFPPSLKKKNEARALCPSSKKQAMKNEKLFKLASNNLNDEENYFATKIPIRTLYVTRQTSFCGK